MKKDKHMKLQYKLLPSGPLPSSNNSTTMNQDNKFIFICEHIITNKDKRFNFIWSCNAISFGQNKFL